MPAACELRAIFAAVLGATVARFRRRWCVLPHDDLVDPGRLRSDRQRVLDAGSSYRVALGRARALRARRRREPADHPRGRHRAADQAFARGAASVRRRAAERHGVRRWPRRRVAVAAWSAPTPCDPTQPGAYHLIVFRDDGWAYDDPSNTLALTTVTYGIDSAVLFDAEIEINSHDHTLTTSSPRRQARSTCRRS